MKRNEYVSRMIDGSIGEGAPCQGRDASIVESLIGPRAVGTKPHRVTCSFLQPMSFLMVLAMLLSRRKSYLLHGTS